MSATQQAQQRRRPAMVAWLTSAAGVVTIVAVAVAVAALVVAVHEAARASQLTTELRQQHGQAAGSLAPRGSAYLSNLQATVDNADDQNAPQVMSAKSYPNSVTFGCAGPYGAQPDEAFDVVGYRLFTAVIGIPDDAIDATSLSETVTFASQAGARLGAPVTVSLGHPVTVRLAIAGVTQLEITCTGVNAQTRQAEDTNDVTLGNALISP